MRVVTAGTATFALIFQLFFAALGHAQSPASPEAAPTHAPQTGFVSAYEVARTVRLAGFDPLAPPLREGTIYVVRATDFRGVLMRVVVDAHTGVIRDAARIISASEAGLPPPPHPLPYGIAPAPYDTPPYIDPLDGIPSVEADEAPELAPPPGRLVPRSSVPPIPLPRPRPSSLVERSDDGAKTAPIPGTAVQSPETVVPAPPLATGSAPQPGATLSPSSDEKRDAPAPAPTTRNDNTVPGAAAKPGRAAPPPPVTIND